MVATVAVYSECQLADGLLGTYIPPAGRGPLQSWMGSNIPSCGIGSAHVGWTLSNFARICYIGGEGFHEFWSSLSYTLWLMMKDGNGAGAEQSCVLFLDAAFRFLPCNNATFVSYVKSALQSSHGVHLFDSGYREDTLTTEHVFRYYNVSAEDKLIRKSGQLLGGVQLLCNNGPGVMKYLDTLRHVIEHDRWLITDCYNAEARALNPDFGDHRHDQSLSSILYKKMGETAIPFQKYFDQGISRRRGYPFFVNCYGRKVPKNETLYQLETAQLCAGKHQHIAVKPGGLLIFHDRYVQDPVQGDRLLSRNIYHPIRLRQRFFDLFLSDFEIIYNNCDGQNARTAKKGGFSGVSNDGKT
eukprot:scaffold74063_cov61-Attheya_sp.AAC.1